MTEQEQTHVGFIQDLKMQLEFIDLDYLENSYKGIRDKVSFQESAMILNPNPFSAVEQNEMEWTKVNFLKAIIDLKKSYDSLKESTLKYEATKANSNMLSKFFGG